MNDELRTFCKDLEERLRWLTEEVLRLNEEAERLKRENESLREDATLVRLYRDLEADVSPKREPVPSISSEAKLLFEQLPHSFRFGDFFQVAESFGMCRETAKGHMLVLLRTRLLMQRGTLMEKRETLMENRAQHAPLTLRAAP